MRRLGRRGRNARALGRRTVLAVAVAVMGAGAVQVIGAPATGAAVPCTPVGPVPAAFLTCRNWISYAPPAPFDPTTGTFPTEAQIRTSLQQLYGEGWRGLVTYDMEGTLREVPRIAKEVGFAKVVAGIFWFDAAQLERERPAAVEEKAWFDGLVVGNEGLLSGRYTQAALTAELDWVRTNTGRPVATTETVDQYLSDPTLLALGDWVFPNVHPWWHGVRTVAEAAAWTADRFRALELAAGGGTVVVKEAWWPTGGTDPAATQANQQEYFHLLSRTPVRFLWGEAYDQFWKTGEPEGVGPHWGFHTSAGTPKAVVGGLGWMFTSAYPPAPEPTGFTWFSNGAPALSGPRGSLITAYATGARLSSSYLLVTGTHGVNDPPCRFDVQAVNLTLRRSSSTGFIPNTAGVLDRPPGTWDVCFYEVAPGVPGRTATAFVQFTVTG